MGRFKRERGYRGPTSIQASTLIVGAIVGTGSCGVVERCVARLDSDRMERAHTLLTCWVKT
jgi:hypothetical protein